MDQSIIFLLAGLIIVGGLLFAVIGLNRKGTKHLDVDKYRVRWLRIEQAFKKTEPSSYGMAVLEADKLVDQAMKDMGIVGKNMGERLRSSTKKFSDLDSVWGAHKLRNKIAHEIDAKVSYDQTRHCLACFKKALRDLGAI